MPTGFDFRALTTHPTAFRDSAFRASTVFPLANLQREE
jgi:hypothetical protein